MRCGAGCANRSRREPARCAPAPRRGRPATAARISRGTITNKAGGDRPQDQPVAGILAAAAKLAQRFRARQRDAGERARGAEHDLEEDRDLILGAGPGARPAGAIFGRIARAQEHPGEDARASSMAALKWRVRLARARVSGPAADAQSRAKRATPRSSVGCPASRAEAGRTIHSSQCGRGRSWPARALIERRDRSHQADQIDDQVPRDHRQQRRRQDVEPRRPRAHWR